jgi:hypothetical protein
MHADSGVVDQCVDSPVLSHRALDKSPALRFDRNVCGDAYRPPAATAALGGDDIEELGISRREHQQSTLRG